MTKPKRVQKSKQDIVNELATKEHMDRMIPFINEQYLPLLAEVTENLKDTRLVTEALTASINRAFESKAASVKVSELGLSEMLNDKFEGVEKYRKMLDVLKDQTVIDAMKVLQGTFAEVDKKMMDEWEAKSLKDFLNTK
jgi:hypothetical protein